jgi:hypothetical protein
MDILTRVMQTSGLKKPFSTTNSPQGEHDLLSAGPFVI